MAKSMDDIKKEVEELSNIVNIVSAAASWDIRSRVLSALIIAKSIDGLTDAVREAGKEIADNLVDIS